MTTEIEIQKNDFVSKFKQNVDEESTGLFSSFFEAFSSSINEYKGQVGYDGFKIKRKRKFIDTNMNIAVASGTYRQNSEKLIIETEINGFSKKMIPFYLFILIFYSILIGTFLKTDSIGRGVGFPSPFMVIHAAFMFYLPYLMMRRSTKRMRHELEREFYYMTKK